MRKQHLNMVAWQFDTQFARGEGKFAWGKRGGQRKPKTITIHEPQSSTSSISYRRLIEALTAAYLALKILIVLWPIVHGVALL